VNTHSLLLVIGAVFKLRRVRATGSSRRRSLKTEQRVTTAQSAIAPSRGAKPLMDGGPVDI
jgi:hypothetical protein